MRGYGRVFYNRLVIGGYTFVPCLTLKGLGGWYALVV